MKKIAQDHRVRFAATGVAMTLLHLAIFHGVSPFVLPEVANAIAFVLSTQVNFFISYHWTWASRRAGGRESLRVLARRALLFNASVGVAFGANCLAFLIAHRVVGLAPTPSVLTATVVSAAVSYLVSSRLVFARTTARSAVVLPPTEVLETPLSPLPTR